MKIQHGGEITLIPKSSETEPFYCLIIQRANVSACVDMTEDEARKLLNELRRALK